MISTQTVAPTVPTERSLASEARRGPPWLHVSGLLRMRRLSLQWEMALLLLTGLLLLFGLFALLSSRLSDETARAMAADRLSAARLTVTLIDQEFEEQFEQLEWTAQRMAALGSDTRVARADILRPHEPFITRLTRVDASGRVQWSEPGGMAVLRAGSAALASSDATGADWSELESVRQPMITGARYASGVMRAPENPMEAVVMFSVPVPGQHGEPIGVLVAELHVSDALDGVLGSAARQLGASGHAELLDQNLQLIVSSEPGRVLGPAEHPSFYKSLLEAHTSAVGLTDPIGDEDPQDRGERHVMAFVPLSSVPWGLGLGGSESVFTNTADRWRGETLGLGGVGLAIALFLVWVTRRGVVKPLTALTQRSLRIAAGDLGSPVPLTGSGEVRVLAQTLEDMRAQLSEARASEMHLSRMKDEFVATAAHELRSPVAALRIFSQLTSSRARRGNPIDIQATLEEVRVHTERLNGLVTRLLDTSRIQENGLELAREPTDLADLAREVVRMVAPILADERRIVLDASAPVWANVDRLRLAQVLSNLVDNAIKFTPRGGRIDVRVETDDASARLSVHDNGPGIPPSLSDQVFERFYKAPGQGPRQGLGLGLYISRQIVELHGGRIRVDSPPEGGARFVISLPTGE